MTALVTHGTESIHSAIHQTDSPWWLGNDQDSRMKDQSLQNLIEWAEHILNTPYHVYCFAWIPSSR